MLKKLATIKDMRLDLESKAQILFTHYLKKDLEGVRKLYEKTKDNPGVPRNTPPAAGCIQWARQLYRRIEEPMLFFNEHTRVLIHPDSRKHVKAYNKFAKTLVEFEMLWHKAWIDLVDYSKSGLDATLLVADSQLNLYVNFDPQVRILIKETYFMHRLQLEIPAEADAIFRKEAYFKNIADQLSEVIAQKKEILGKLTPVLLRAIRPHIDILDRKIQPGMTALIWNSLSIQPYIDEIFTALGALEQLVNKVNSISVRIDSSISKIGELCLCEIPNELEQWTTENFIEKTDKRCQAVSQSIRVKTNFIEASSKEILGELQNGIAKPYNLELKLAYESLYFSFNVQSVESLIHCTRGSLDLLRNRLGNLSSTQYNKVQPNRPFFSCELTLMVPSVIIQPKLEDVQQALNKVTNMIIDVSKKLTHNWKPILEHNEEPGLIPRVPEDLNQISNNKDVVKLIVNISSLVNVTKKDIESHRDYFNKFDFLWKEDRHDSIQKFCESNPHIIGFENFILKYGSIEAEIKEIASVTNIGLVSISCEALKAVLISEANSWKQQYGFSLNKKVKSEMESLTEYMETKNALLNKKISDIDDLRMAYSTLIEIREQEVDIDMRLAPIEEAYLILNKHNISISKEETEVVDTLRFSWKKVKNQVLDVQGHLTKIRPVFEANLIGAVEKFVQDAADFTTDYEENGPMVFGIPPRMASDRLNVFQRAFDELNRRWEMYAAGEQLFSLPQTEILSLVKIKKELKLLQNLYSLYNDVLSKRLLYNETLWSDINAELMNSDANDFQAKIKKLPKAIKDWIAFNELRDIVDNLANVVPLLEMMSHKAMQGRHWESIQKICNTTFDLDPEFFTLKKLLDAPLVANREDIEDICTSAVKEKDIESKLKLIVAEWEDKVFILAPFKTRGNLVLKPAATSEIITQLEDSLMTLGSLMSNRYNAPFKAQIQTWVHHLSTASEVIENWLSVQSLWIYLEAVFVGGDIAKQMPKEAKRFSNIDKSWCKIMALANENANVIKCCVLDETISGLLPYLTEQLELCQKSLSGYLEAKRAIFPRFYFVSDPALLEILGQASDSHTIQAHLKSVTENIQNVVFNEKEYDRIMAMESSEGERVMFSKPMIAAGNVELWLGSLLKCMQVSINDIIREASSRVNDLPLQKFMDEYPAQIGLLCIQLQWTQICEDAIVASKTDKKKMGTALQKVTDILNTLIDITTKELSKIDRVKYETLITIQVHHRDVFEKLVKGHVKTIDDFEWLKQARFYWNETKDCCMVSITNFEFKYQCEYLGCTDRLVITPLTDRCYITLAQAIGMSLGGSPAGPAGTDLNNALNE